MERMCDELAGGWTGRLDERILGRMDRKMDGRTDLRTSERWDVLTDERMDGRTDCRTEKRTEERTDGWQDERRVGTDERYTIARTGRDERRPAPSTGACNSTSSQSPPAVRHPTTAIAATRPSRWTQLPAARQADIGAVAVRCRRSPARTYSPTRLVTSRTVAFRPDASPLPTRRRHSGEINDFRCPQVGLRDRKWSVYESVYLADGRLVGRSVGRSIDRSTTKSHGKLLPSGGLSVINKALLRHRCRRPTLGGAPVAAGAGGSGSGS